MIVSTDTPRNLRHIIIRNNVYNRPASPYELHLISIIALWGGKSAHSFRQKLGFTVCDGVNVDRRDDGGAGAERGRANSD